MDSLMLGLSTTLIGMLVVFVGLVILIVCIYGMTCLTGRAQRPLPRSLKRRRLSLPRRKSPPWSGKRKTTSS